MQVRLTKPELEKFVDDQVKAGRFSSAEAVVESALNRMIQDQRELDEEDIGAINAAEDEIDRGEYVELEQFAAEMRRKHQSK